MQVRKTRLEIFGRKLVAFDWSNI